MNKSDFPIFNQFPKLIYLDNAATTQKPSCVIDAYKEFYEKHNANVHRGIYKLSEDATALYEASRQAVAEFIGAKSDEIVFTSGTTMSINLLAQYHFWNALEAGSTILLSDLEHHSNILPWQSIAKEQSLNLDYIHLNSNLEFDLNQIEATLKTQKVGLISISLMSNVTGYTPPIKQIKELINKHSPQTLLLLDAAQAISHMSIDVNELDADFIVFSAHKAYGPTGLGVIWGKQNHLKEIQSLFQGGGIVETVTRDSATFIEGPQRFEAGTPPIAEAAVFAKALKYLKSIGLEEIKNHEMHLAESLHKRLKEIPEIKLLVENFDPSHFGPIISFTHAKLHPHDLAQILDYKDIAVRAGHHCTQILHREVLHIPSSARVSLALYNEEADIEALIDALKNVSINR